MAASASAYQVKLSLDNRGILQLPDLTQRAADKASELLQENHEKHHIFFNQSGFHNHIAHHILTLYALGASPELMQTHFDRNKTYQRKVEPFDHAALEDLHDRQKFHDYLGNERYYRDYLEYFRGEIDKKGYEDTINEYCLKGDERADDMLVRLHAGFLHPMIHLGFGVEFRQPAVIAEALAQAAVHDSWIAPFMLESEKEAAFIRQDKLMVELLDEIRADKVLSSAAEWDDPNKIRDGIFVRAFDQMIRIAAKWKVKPDAIIEKTAEMTNAAVYYTGGVQHPPKQIKFDFYYMHCVNCSIFYGAFLKNAAWITDESKARLLEWKGRLDLCMYASRRSPEPRMDIIRNYKPKHSGTAKDVGVGKGPWGSIFARVVRYNDDGHAAKLIRALAHGEDICATYGADDQRFRIKSDMWSQLAHMVIDSVEDSGETWVRSAGFLEAWEKYEDSPQAQL